MALAYAHDRKGGGLVVSVLDPAEETLVGWLFQIVFSRGPFTVEPSIYAGARRGVSRVSQAQDARHSDL